MACCIITKKMKFNLNFKNDLNENNHFKKDI